MKHIFIFFLVISMGGCVSIPPDTFVTTSERLQQRQMETRRYDNLKEVDLIVASSNVLQDLGFSLDNSEVKLGVITASKERDATNGAQIAGAIFLTLLSGAPVPYDVNQTIRVSLVVRPLHDSNGKIMSGSNFVRVSFQKVVRRSDKSEIASTLRDEQLFKDFYDKLSKSVFIEAQKI